VDCEIHEAQITLTGEDEVVALSSDAGQPLLTLSIPGELTQDASQGGVMNILLARERNPVEGAKNAAASGSGTSPLPSAVVDITLQVDGQVMTSLVQPLQICLWRETGDLSVSDYCLAYYDVVGLQWLCQDVRLALNSDGQYCGDTDHLTSFALLLGGDTGSSGEYFPESTIAWLSLGFIAGALVIITLAIGIIEVQFRIYRSRARKAFRRLNDQIHSNPSI